MKKTTVSNRKQNPPSRPLVQVTVQRRKYHEQHNPVRGLSAAKARALLEGYLRGEFTELMWAFGAPMVGIESADPDYLALIQRRLSRLGEMDWDIRTADDSAPAKRQAEELRRAYDKLDNLQEGITHLAMATFRGFAHVEVDLAHDRLVPVMQWNVARDGVRGDWKYNPDAAITGFDSLPEEYRVDPEKGHWWLIREVARPVGAYALMKYFYAHLGITDWAEFCDIFGIPGGFVVGPPNVPQDEERQYAAWAVDALREMGGYLPHGSEYQQHSAPAGGQPYGPFLEYLAQRLVLAGTGGQLTMLTAAGSGTLAGGAHQETFRELAAMEAKEISEIFQRQFDRRVLARSGLVMPGERPLAWFEIAHQQESDVGEIIDHAAKLSAAGYRLDPAQIEEKTGYRLSLAGGAVAGADGTTLQNRCNGLQNRFRGSHGSRQALANKSPYRAKIAGFLARVDAAGELTAELVREGLGLLDALEPQDVVLDDLAAELERVMMAAVVQGAVDSADAATDTANVPAAVNDLEGIR